MDENELQSLLLSGESDRTEFKESAAYPKKIRQTICALANDLPNHRAPGVVFIGIDDKGKCTGLPINDQLQRQLSDMRADGKITPFPQIEITKMKAEGCEFLAVVIYPSESPPIRFDGRVFVRVGPTTRQATAEEERRLTEKRRAADLPFDMRPIKAASLSDLDLELFLKTYLPEAIPKDILELNVRTVTEQLASMRFVTPNDIPTAAGLLVLGRDARSFIPGAYIQFVRFAGAAITDDIKDQREIDGTILDILRQLDETLKVHVSTAINIKSGDQDTRYPDFPIVALQQLTRNAVLHRTYEGTNAPVRIHWFSDRIEIINPGGPFGIVTQENFGKPGVADYRNPQLAESMKSLGYVQKFGVGIQMARNELEKNGNRLPDFQIDSSFVLATVWGR